MYTVSVQFSLWAEFGIRLCSTSAQCWISIKSIIQQDPFMRFCYDSLSYLHLCMSVLLYSDVKADKAIEKILISLFTFSPGFPFNFAGFTVKTKYANESGIGSRLHSGGRPSACGRKPADSAKVKNWKTTFSTNLTKLVRRQKCNQSGGLVEVTEARKSCSLIEKAKSIIWMQDCDTLMIYHDLHKGRTSRSGDSFTQSNHI